MGPTLLGGDLTALHFTLPTRHYFGRSIHYALLDAFILLREWRCLGVERLIRIRLGEDEANRADGLISDDDGMHEHEVLLIP